MRKNRGFTLIEILVVIAIIAAIMGGVSLMIRQAGITQKKTIAKTRIAGLAAAIEQLHGPDKLNMYPPTRSDKLLGPGSQGPVGKRIGCPNDSNVGIETVYAALHLKGINITPDGFADEDAYGNLDGDKAGEAVPDMPNADLWEYLDPWGQPYVYFSSRDYKDVKGVERYVLSGGKDIKVAPKKLPNGEFVHANAFQLFSLGPDGEPGTDDDIDY